MPFLGVYAGEHLGLEHMLCVESGFSPNKPAPATTAIALPQHLRSIQCKTLLQAAEDFRDEQKQEIRGLPGSPGRYHSSPPSPSSNGGKAIRVLNLSSEAYWPC